MKLLDSGPLKAGQGPAKTGREDRGLSISDPGALHTARSRLSVTDGGLRQIQDVSKDNTEDDARPGTRPYV